MVTKLTITRCDENGAVKSGAKKFEVMLNPEGYTHNFEITYNEKSALGSARLKPKFHNSGKQNIIFKKMVIDGTGVVPVSGTASDVKTRIKNLNDIVYTYDGTEHQPNTVRLLWGSFIFCGRLKTMSVEYVLFKPNGEPLRANVTLAFIGSVGSLQEALLANTSSPDLTHLVEVMDGDSLPLMCYRIYKDSSYYLEVAKTNGITNFRDLKPGTRLNFPPLR